MPTSLQKFHCERAIERTHCAPPQPRISRPTPPQLPSLLRFPTRPPDLRAPLADLGELGSARYRGALSGALTASGAQGISPARHAGSWKDKTKSPREAVGSQVSSRGRGSRSSVRSGTGHGRPRPRARAPPGATGRSLPRGRGPGPTPAQVAGRSWKSEGRRGGERRAPVTAPGEVGGTSAERGQGGGGAPRRSPGGRAVDCEGEGDAGISPPALGFRKLVA